MRTIILLVILGYGVTFSHATNAHDGNRMAKWCKDTAPEQGFCYGMIYGFTALMEAKKDSKICVPSGWKTGQVLEVYRQYLRENPQRWHEHALILLTLSLQEAFPCAK